MQVGICLLAMLAVTAVPFPVSAAQPMDQEFAQHVREWTTRPEFSSPLVDHLPASDTVPSPRQVLGHDIGEPRKLDYYADLLKFYRALAAKSPRVGILEIGKTEEGRDNIVVMLSAADNIRDLEANRQNLARLADPRGLSQTQAQELIAHTKPIYHLMGGLHSSETGPAEMLLELAYRLAAEESPLLEKIRSNLIVAITPATDPDGRDRYTDWYYRNKIDDTDDLNPVPDAPYWGKYIFHDDNRDINYSGASARNLLAYYLRWHPPIMHDLHESVPFLYTYSGQAPQNPDLDPILYGELPWFSNFEMSQLTKYGMPGVWTHGFVDAWSPGYVGFMSSNHNGMLRMYETFGNAGATTMLRHVAPVPGQPKEPDRPDQTTRDWFRPSPPYKEVQWSIRNNTNYMETAALTGLQLAGDFPDVVPQNFYRKSRNSVEAGATEPPYGYIFPAGQPDMTRAAFVLNLLRLQGIEVGRATGEIRLQEGTFPAGSLLVKRNQPYGRLAKILLETQQFPQGDLKSYDDTAWTMGLMAHTKVVESGDRKVLDIPVEPLERIEVKGDIEAGPAAAYAVLDYGSANLATLRYRLKKLPIRVAEQAFKSRERTVPAGSFVLDGRAYSRLKPEVEALGLHAIALSAQPTVPLHAVALPRIALYSTWGSTQNVGWVRYAFDQFETPYALIFKEQVRKGHLRSAYDVIIIPSQGRSAQSLVYDLEVHGKPLPYTRTAQFKYLGAYGSSEDIRGGMACRGAIERNVRAQTQIVNDLLDMSRIISGKIHLEVQPLLLHEVIHNAIEVVRASAEAKKLRLRTMLDSSIGLVRGDPNRLQQILWNLLSNAVKFTPSGGRIQIVLERVSSHVELVIEDTGIGIRPEFLPYVFERFRQADAALTRRHGGLGLGLSIVKTLAELHGGSVRVKSTGENQGATFVVALPISHVRSEDAQLSQRLPALSDPLHAIELPRLEGAAVLIVDDEADGRLLMTRIIEGQGARVTSVMGGARALELMDREHFDILVSDIGMPDLDGYELMRRVRALAPKNGAPIPAIAVTAYARAEDRQRSLLAGYQMHLAKPVEARELIAGIASLLRLRR